MSVAFLLSKLEDRRSFAAEVGCCVWEKWLREGIMVTATLLLTGYSSIV
jgi:hypothetical protein